MNASPANRRPRHRVRLLPAAAAIVATAARLWAADYYVSPDGDDRHDGRGANAAQAFRTIQRGVDALAAGDRLVVRAGTYRETVRFARDGETGAPIVVAAYPGEQPVLSGLDPLAGWTAAGGDRWTTSMPWTLGRGRNQLFVGASPLCEARHPNTATPGFVLRDEKGVELPLPWPRFGPFSIPDQNDPNTIRLPAGETYPEGWWTGAIYQGQHWDGWLAQCAVVTGSRGDTLSVNPEKHGWWFPLPERPYSGPEAGRGMLTGHLHALDAPGEWVRADDGVVTLQVAPGTTPTGVEAKRRQLALDLTGRHHIEVRGLRILGASATLRDAKSCTLQGCTFEWLAHFTWFAGVTGDIGRYGWWDEAMAGEAGVYVSGAGNVVRDSTFHGSAGSGVFLDGYGHTIHNCLIEHAGYAGSYLGAIWIHGHQYRMSGGHRITRNTLRYSPRMLLGLAGMYANSPAREAQPYAAMQIEGNEIHTGLLLSRDGGLLYWTDVDGGAWNGRKSAIRHNVIYDCRDSLGIGMVYLDAGGCNFDVSENLFWAPPGTTQRPVFFSAPSAGCTRRDNRIFPESTRNPAALSPDDFPGGTRFAFGHDHVQPPALPEWSEPRTFTVSAVRRVAQSGGLAFDGRWLTGWRHGDWAAFDVPHVAGWSTVVVRAAGDDGFFNANVSRQFPAEPRHVRTADPLVLASNAAEQRSDGVMLFAQAAFGFRNGSWLRFRNVALGDGFRQVRLGYSSNVSSARHAELRLDRADGPLVATIPLDDFGGRVEPPSNMLIPTVQVTAPLSTAATGTHDLYLVTLGEGGDELVQIHQTLLEGYRGTLSLADDEVRLEVRAGYPDGPLLATLFPGYVGGEYEYQRGAVHQWAATLDTSGVSPGEARICLVVRTRVADPQLRVESVRLERPVIP